MTILRSALFMLWFALVSATLAILFLPVLLLPRRATVWMATQWCRLTLWGLNAFAGLTYEVRGTPPHKGVIVAAKHMSMWDTMALFMLVGDPAMILKRELLRVPFYGWYLWGAGMIAIDRSAGASALRKMSTEAKSALADGRPILIFPEGTRKKPHAPPDYKPGVAGLYGQLDVSCVPVALNSGLFWTGPGGFLKKRGRIVVEFLPPIPAGLPRREFLALLQQRIESATDRLVAEGEAQLTRSNLAPA
jgi:1-acyl-sn-glycerol-3-phosphate acyltransferase